MTAKTKSTSKYTAEMEQAIRDAAPLDLKKATDLAATKMFADAGVTARGIAAKARTMQVEYIKQERTSKDGTAVAKKDELVAKIAEVAGVKATAIKSLEKAEKADLKRLLAALTASDEDADADATETVAA